ncbi:MAG TPA: hypothetical protein VFH68_15480 [Polyangia bacterium]|jgi:hypothetical protein|nr:hypothetical protein [Polyangia bacterium]
MKPRNVKVGIAIATALAGGLGVPSGAFARSRWENVIAPAARGRVRPAPAPAASDASDEREPRVEKVRASSAAAARATAASYSAPAPSYSYREDRDDAAAADRARVSSRMLEHAAGDRLREALAAAGDDPRSTARISRLITLAAAEARRNKALADRVWYWRDPFSPNPRRAIVLSLETQLEMQVAAARLEAARARVESNAARLEAAQAHVEAARARLEAARAQGPSARNGAVAARHDSRLARPAGEDDAPPRTARRSPTVAPTAPAAGGDARGGDSARVRRRAATPRSVSSSPTSETALARNENTGAAARATERHRDIDGAGSLGAPAAAAGPEDSSASPTGWRSRDPRGIVVVPMNTPVADLPRPAARP